MKVFLKNKFKEFCNKLVGTIFMLHRVSPFETERLFPNENMKVSPEFLENFIVQNRENFNFVALDEVKKIIEKKIKTKKPFITFTFDDGYKDNYSYAFPIFRKYDVPFTIYVTTDIPDKKALIWWYILEDIILKNDSIILNTGEIFVCPAKEEKEIVFLEIRNKILGLPVHGFETNFSALLSAYHFNEDEYVNRLGLSWENLKEMSKDSLCTIGSHSVSHKRLSRLNENDLSEEILKSKLILERGLEKEIIHFAYPFGMNADVNPMVIDFVMKSGFQTACLAFGGPVKEGDKDLFRLNRVMLSESR